MRSHVGRRRERNIHYKGVKKPLTSRRALKTVRLMTICNRSKRTISASSGLELLQMVSKPDIERCASEDVDPKGSGL